MKLYWGAFLSRLSPMSLRLAALARPALVLAFVIATPLAARAQPRLEAAPLVTPFSTGKPPALPAPWTPVPIAANKTPTAYDLVVDQGTVVLHARADAAASGLGHSVAFDLQSAPILEWRWKVGNLVEGADNSDPTKEDSPARIVLQFDGTKSRLSLKDRAYFVLGKQLSGQEPAYATLMYVWSNRAPVGAVIPNPRTGRVQMVVVGSGATGVGTWQTIRRNVIEDFRRAFGEEPGPLTAVGVLTDTDNTGKSVEAWYGDLRFLPEAQ